MTGADVKKLLLSLGADLCGIASLDRFDAAPKGFHPRDVYPQCKTVISFAPELAFQFIVISSPDIVSGKDYTITVDGENAGNFTAS